MKCTTYIELFVGGANVIDKIKCERKIGSDKNKYLIELLKRVQVDKPLLDSVSKELYDDVQLDFYNRNKNNHTPKFHDWEIGNIGFLASYNGRFFDGGYGKTVYEKTKKWFEITGLLSRSKKEYFETIF